MIMIKILLLFQIEVYLIWKISFGFLSVVSHFRKCHFDKADIFHEIELILAKTATTFCHFCKTATTFFSSRKTWCLFKDFCFSSANYSLSYEIPFSTKTVLHRIVFLRGINILVLVETSFILYLHEIHELQLKFKILFSGLIPIWGILHCCPTAWRKSVQALKADTVSIFTKVHM